MGLNDSLLFDGGDDHIVCDAGDLLNVGLDAHSFFAIVKRGDDTSFDGIMYGGDSGGSGKCGLSIRADDFLLIDCDTIDGICEDAGAGSATSTIEADTAFGWMILGYTKAAGSAATPVFHRYRYGTTTWTHENGSQPLNELRNSLNEFFIGAWMDAGAANDHFVGNILLTAWFESDLGDGSAVEAYFSGIELSLEGWMAKAELSELMRLDSMSTLNARVGTMGEISRTGTSLDVGDVPAGWSDGAGPEIIYGRREHERNLFPWTVGTDRRRMPTGLPGHPRESGGPHPAGGFDRAVFARGKVMAGAEKELVGGQANGVATASGTVVRDRALTGTANGVATASGAVVRERALTGSATGALTATGEVTKGEDKILTGTANGALTATGAVVRDRALTGAATGVLTATGAVVRDRAITGSAIGVLSASGTVVRDRARTGAATGVLTATGAVVRDRARTGQANGVLTATGTLFKEGGAIGPGDGRRTTVGAGT